VALPDAPPALVRAAINLWPAGQPARPAAIVRGLLRTLAATLSFDSWSVAPLAAGVRTLRSPVRHLLFSADGRDIDLRVTPAGQAFALTGQVLGPDETGQIELLQLPESDIRLAALDALGEFRLDGVGAGSYQLTLRLGGDEIVLPTIDVGPPSV
jgi:hypothetical protein